MELSKNAEEEIKRIHDLIRDYGKRSATMTGDQLLKMNDSLSVAYCYLGEQEANYNRDSAFSYSNRLQVKASNIIKRIAEGEAITKLKESIEDDDEVISARFNEITNSYIAENVQNLLKGISRILNAIDKRLMYLYKEQKQMEKPNTR